MPSSSSQHRLHSAWIDDADDSKFRVAGYRWSSFKLFLSWTGILLSLGLLRLIFYWKPKWHVEAMCEPCSLHEADIIFVTDEHKREAMRPVRVSDPMSTNMVLPCKGGVFTPVQSYRFFTFRKLKYIWHPKYHAFCSAFPLDEQVPLKSFEKWGHEEEGLSTEKYLQRLAVYGENSIAVKVKPIWKLLFLEVISPFYIFQIFSVLIWFNDEYIYYASVIVAMSVLSIAADVYQTRNTEKKLRDMVHSVDMVTCIRDGKSIDILSNGLVPGDVLVIPKHGCILQCDAVLLTGTCIVNESMLTGESVPVTKTSLPIQEDTSVQGSAFEPIYTNKEHGKHTLFCGTNVLQTRYYSKAPVKALVIRTGYSTMKGQLVRSIMYPKPVDFQFTKDLLRFIGVLCCIALIGFGYTIVLMVIRGNEAKKVILRSLDIITIVVPPALPAAMTIGILAAQMRLQKKKIHCISPSTINTCGGINLVCFDKTGTLTEDGLDFNCILPSGPGTPDSGPIVFGDEREDLDDVDHEQNEMVQAMAACHSLTTIEGEICGDPMDLILFRQTEWILEEPEVVEESGRFDMMAPTSVRPPMGAGKFSSSNSSGETGGFSIGILRQFTFSSELQRMSVMVRRMGEKDLMLFCKGAPETVAGLCDPATIPSSFSSSLKKYARKGYRVLGIAKRHIQLSFVKAQRVQRDQVECDLEFLGLVVLENRLKPETQPVIQQLLRAQIRPVMVTGDNLLTAVSVARECGVLDSRKTVYMLETGEKNHEGQTKLILRREDHQKQTGSAENSLQSSTSSYLPSSSSTSINDLEARPLEFGANYQLAMTGGTFAVISKEYPGLLNRLVCVCNVFARMSPDQKAQLVGALQGLDHIVAMCGDGANDCGALKAAHAGISLSEAEASIASPFTSQTPNITCVPTVIREGRAALVTSFGVFKYMAGYSMTQFCSVCLLYWIATNLADFQFLYIDLFLITVFAVFFGYTDAAETLVPQPPPTRILSLPSIASIILQLIIIMSVQVFMFLFVKTQPWFVPFTDPGEEDNYFSYQGTVLFWSSVYQYIGLAIIYSKSYPYRKPLFNNRLLTASLVIMTAISLWWTLYPPKAINDWLNLMEPPFIHYRAFILVVAAIGFILSYLVETWIVEYLLFEKAQERKWFQNTQQQPKHVDVLEEIGDSPQWLRSAIDRRNRGASGTWDKISSPSSPTISSADEERDLLRKDRSSRKISTEL